MCLQVIDTWKHYRMSFCHHHFSLTTLKELFHGQWANTQTTELVFVLDQF